MERPELERLVRRLGVIPGFNAFSDPVVEITADRISELCDSDESIHELLREAEKLERWTGVAGLRKMYDDLHGKWKGHSWKGSENEQGIIGNRPCPIFVRPLDEAHPYIPPKSTNRGCVVCWGTGAIVKLGHPARVCECSKNDAGAVQHVANLNQQRLERKESCAIAEKRSKAINARNSRSRPVDHGQVTEELKNAEGIAAEPRRRPAASDDAVELPQKRGA